MQIIDPIMNEQSSLSFDTSMPMLSDRLHTDSKLYQIHKSKINQQKLNSQLHTPKNNELRRQLVRSIDVSSSTQRRQLNSAKL